MNKCTEQACVTTNSLGIFNEVLRPFDECYYALRRYNTLNRIVGDRATSALYSETCDLVRYKIEDIFIPLLSEFLAGNPRPNTAEVLPLYQTVPRIRNYLALSSYFMASSVAYLTSQRGVEMRQKLKSMLGRATEIMEYHASYKLEKLLNSLPATSIPNLIRSFTHPRQEFKDIALDFERIPAAHSELTHCKFNSNDNVLFIGCGSLSISGLAFANAGARVTLVDIDPQALESFSRVYSSLPKYLQERIERKVVIPGDYCYLSKENYNYIALAGLVGQKDEILQSVSQCLGCGDTNPTLLIRAPKANLLKLFYYDAHVSKWSDSFYQIAEPGIEAPIVTNVAKLNLNRSHIIDCESSYAGHTELLSILRDYSVEALVPSKHLTSEKNI